MSCGSYICPLPSVELTLSSCPYSSPVWLRTLKNQLYHKNTPPIPHRRGSSCWKGTSQELQRSWSLRKATRVPASSGSSLVLIPLSHLPFPIHPSIPIASSSLTFISERSTKNKYSSRGTLYWSKWALKLVSGERGKPQWWGSWAELTHLQTWNRLCVKWTLEHWKTAGIEPTLFPQAQPH